MSLLWIAALLYFLAVILAFVDLFIPSGGALMILGAISAVASVVFGFQQGAMAGSLMLLVVLGTIPVFGFLAVRVWPNTPIGRRVIMRPRRASREQDARARKESDQIETLIGTVFRADADLMPSGTIRIEGNSLNAMAESGFVEAGQVCEIVNYRERQFIVRPTQKSVSNSKHEASPKRSGYGAAADSEAEPSEQSTSQPEDSERSLLDLPADEFDLDSLTDETADKERDRDG
ncbi:MAG: hypothetical protein Aurels2KO_35500 [Aureliella sp.]